MVLVQTGVEIAQAPVGQQVCEREFSGRGPREERLAHRTLVLLLQLVDRGLGDGIADQLGRLRQESIELLEVERRSAVVGIQARHFVRAGCALTNRLVAADFVSVVTTRPSSFADAFVERTAAAAALFMLIFFATWPTSFTLKPRVAPHDDA